MINLGKKAIRNVALLATAAFIATANPSYADEIKINRKEYNRTYEKTENTLFKKVENMGEDISSNIVSREEMYETLKKPKVVIFAENHANLKNREVQIEILNGMKTPNLVVGLEIFRVNDQKYLDDYIENKTNLKEFLGGTIYQDPNLSDSLTRLGYIDLLKSLKKDGTKTLGINYRIDEETKGAAKRVRTLRDKISLNKSEKNELEEICLREGKKYETQSNDFYGRDKLASEIIDKYTKDGKRVAIVIGRLHAEKNHLPYMIKTVTGIEPVIVSQTSLNFGLEDVYMNEVPKQISSEKKPNLNKFIEIQKKLKKRGLTEDKALVVDNNFYVNTIQSVKDYVDYCSHFGYEINVLDAGVNQ